MVFDILYYMILIIFAIDILVGFMTSYINVSSGDEIFDCKMIAKNYIWHGTFPIDVISNIPFEMIFPDLKFAE